MRMFLTTAMLLALAEQPPPANDLVLDFRGGQFRETVLEYVGPNAKKHVKSEEKGLRITIPAAKKPVPQTGFASKLAVHGDFEITVSFEILQVEKPKAGNGAGVGLTIFAASPANDFATIARRVHPTEGECYFTNRAFKTAEGKNTDSTETFSTSEKSGRLRLVRTGVMLVYLVAAPGSDTFEELRREKFVEQGIRNVRVVGDPGQSTGDLDIRIHSLHVRALELSASQPLLASGGAVFWKVVLVIVVVAAVTAYFIWRFSKRRTVKQ